MHWPDGRVTEGIEIHTKDLEAMFVFAPEAYKIQMATVGTGPRPETWTRNTYSGTTPNS